MSHLMNTYARLPVAFTHGEGAWLWDSNGKRYLDALAGIAVNTLGHAHPKFTAALNTQIFFPDRDFKRDIAFFPLGSGSGIGAINGHGTDGQAFAFKGNDLTEHIPNKFRGSSRNSRAAAK